MSPQLLARRRRTASIRRRIATLTVSVFVALSGTIYAEQRASEATTTTATTAASTSSSTTDTALAPVTTAQS